MAEAETDLKSLPLDALHRARNAKFAPFAGYAMPVQYEGLIAEHNWTRENAGLFDVSHMGPSFLALKSGHGLKGDEAHAAISAVVEPLIPSDIKGLKPGQIRYTVLLNETGGVLDDLMIARPATDDAQGSLYIVVNAGTKEQDFAILDKASGSIAKFTRADDRSLLALQGPKAEAVMQRLSPDAAALKFMHFREAKVDGVECVVARSGYTGEDGFEVLVDAKHAARLAETLLAQPEVKPIGLGARDTLRLEAGLCLYGHELDANITPIEADLNWIIQKRRRVARDFPGAARILAQMERGAPIKRVGFKPKDRAPARDGVEVSKDGKVIGRVTSGGFGPSVGGPISMGYVESQFSAPGTIVDLIVRGQPRAAEIVELPFAPHRYKRSAP